MTPLERELLDALEETFEHFQSAHYKCNCEDTQWCSAEGYGDGNVGEHERILAIGALIERAKEQP